MLECTLDLWIYNVCFGNFLIFCCWLLLWLKSTGVCVCCTLCCHPSSTLSSNSSNSCWCCWWWCCMSRWTTTQSWSANGITNARKKFNYWQIVLLQSQRRGGQIKISRAQDSKFQIRISIIENLCIGLHARVWNRIRVLFYICSHYVALIVIEWHKKAWHGAVIR